MNEQIILIGRNLLLKCFLVGLEKEKLHIITVVRAITRRLVRRLEPRAVAEKEDVREVTGGDGPR
jgi:hypothetical protein